MCGYSFIQNQLSEINQQLNFILKALTQVSCESGIQKERIDILETNMNDVLTTIIEITNDSEPIQILTEGVRTNEKNN
jgi:hypothetical protein